VVEETGFGLLSISKKSNFLPCYSQHDSHQVPTTKPGPFFHHESPNKTPGSVQSGDIPETLKIPRHGRWLPGDIGLIQKWVHHMILHVAAHPKPFLPIIREFQNLIESDPTIYMLFTTMFKEIPAKYKNPIRGHLSSKWKKVQDYVHML
jgi:Phophatidylserine decarboxylase